MKVLIIVFVILFMFPVLAFADVEGCRFTWGWNQMMNFRYGGLFIMSIFLIVAGLVIYFVIANIKSNRYAGKFHETSLNILKKRYAKGEIAQEEFEKIKKDLSQ